MDLLLDLFARHSQNLARAAIILAVILITLSIADTVLFTIDNLTREAATTDVEIPAGNTPERRSGAPVSIAIFDLFGKARQTAATPAVQDAPETKLNLTLEGVFIAGDESGSTAIVAEGSRPGEIYRVGDRLPGNVTLSAVHDDHILIRRGARVEKLRFSEKSLLESGIDVEDSDLPRGVPPRQSVDDWDDEDDTPRTRRRSRRPSTPSPGAASAGGRPSSIGDLVESYRDRINSDPEGLLRELGVEPVDSGNGQGLTIGNQVSSAQLQQAGLQPGDVILSVNGKSVSDVMQDKTLIDQAMAAGRVRVEIQRKDRRFFITVPTK